MKKPFNISSLFTAVIISVLTFSCQYQEETTTPVSKDEQTTPRAVGPWQRTFTDNFDNTGSFSNWQRTSRFDYNSNLCQYDAGVPAIANYDGRNVLVLTATRSGNVWRSGHVKSNYNFKPAVNQEYRVSSQIKLIAMNGTAWTGFSSTYGLWPAFWTV